MKKEEIYKVQEWIPYQNILENGIIRVDDYTYVKIIKVFPINYNLKSELEKEAIINSYKIFLKTCNFDFQILIQSNKENLLNHISKINNQKNIENEKIKKISEKYIEYIKEINRNKKSSNKNFYIIIKKEKNKDKNNKEDIIIDELNDDFYKIKECLSRCGNIVNDISEKDEIKNILYSFLNRRLYNCLS